jgi:gamma-glutamylcyclotransferase (GGCT)/AIG2-like uncharacterized protein YtfP
MDEMTKGSDILFVYGTLMKSVDHAMHQVLVQEAEFLGPATSRGRLYRVDWYPAMVASTDPEDRVRGEAYGLHHPDGTLPLLDHYEGIGPENLEDPEYERVLYPIDIEGLGTVEAWVYLYLHSTASLVPIPSGSFTD